MKFDRRSLEGLPRSKRISDHLVRVKGTGMRTPFTSITAHCPQCRSELPLGLDQAAWLVGGKRSWLFCPLCTRIVAAEPTVARDPTVEKDIQTL
jgi:hypothetical protein